MWKRIVLWFASPNNPVPVLVLVCVLVVILPVRLFAPAMPVTWAVFVGFLGGALSMTLINRVIVWCVRRLMPGPRVPAVQLTISKDSTGEFSAGLAVDRRQIGIDEVVAVLGGTAASMKATAAAVRDQKANPK